ncbi:hypothetical protein [Prevotella intermedia]|uniref:Uncharacterized protein n=1 Tax=Prevotella intermedia TaxID=28131 RepID=A0A2D3L7U6_PREIN|nr:hypothetical protein [Prevotella intermedia]ATV26644.1 hypothetical protein CTM62_07875 [Prevotella intermedia]
MAVIKITSPQAIGNVKLKVIGKPKLILVNGYWNRITNSIGISPGKGKKGYWDFFFTYRSSLNGFLKAAKVYFGDKNYQDIPFYADGSSLFGGDSSGEDRKNKGYEFANQHLAEITKGVGNEKIYFISHSEGAAYAAGMAKALIEKGYKIGESVMLSADEGDEFTIEGNYPCYQITAGRIEKEPNTTYATSTYVPNSVNYPYPVSGQNTKRRFYIDPIVGDHKIKGVNRYGIYIDFHASFSNVHASTIDESIFNKLRQLKTLKVISRKMNGKTEHIIMGKNVIWHKIDDKFVVNNNIDIYHNGKEIIYKK